MSSTSAGPPPVLTLAPFDHAAAEELARSFRVMVDTADGVMAALRVARVIAAAEWRGRLADQFDDRHEALDAECRALVERVAELARRVGAAETGAAAENQRRALSHRRAVESWEARVAQQERQQAAGR